MPMSDALPPPRPILDAIAHELGDGVCATDRAGNLILFNDALEALTGLRRADVIGRPLKLALPFRIADPARPTDLAEALAEALAGGSRRGSDGFLDGARGYPVPVGYALTPVRDGGSVVGAALVVLDLRAIRRAEAAEREARSAAQQADALRRELSGLREVAPGPAGRAGDTAALAPGYAALLERALDERTYHGGRGVSAEVRTLAERLGDAGAGPREVIELHTIALQSRQVTLSPPRWRSLVEESRVVLLELMGGLVLYYRRRTPGRDAGHE